MWNCNDKLSAAHELMSLLKSGKSLQALILLADSHVYKVDTMNTLEEELHLHEKFVEVHKMLRFRDVY